MINCCDFCDTELDCRAHTAAMRAEYEEYARSIKPPPGWVILPFGSPVPQQHRAWDGYLRKWLPARTCRSTMTPITSRRCGHTRLWATTA